MTYYHETLDPSDVDSDTGRPYAGYSSPALDTSFHDGEMDVGDADFETCLSCPWPHQCAARSGCEADD